MRSLITSLLLVSAFVVINDAMAAIAFNNKSNAYDTNCATSAVSHTINDTTDAVLIVAVNIRSLTGITAIDYNGTAMTLLKQQKHASANLTSELWGIIAPTVGANNINITTGPGVGCNIQGFSFTGALQDINNIVDISGGNEGTSNAPSTTLSTSSICALIDALGHEGTNVSSVTGDNTLGGADDQGTWNTAASYAVQISAGNTTMSWSNGASDTYAHAVIAIKPSSTVGLTETIINNGIINQLNKN